MKIYVNGEPREVKNGTTLAALIGLLGFSKSRTAVERNRCVVSRDAYGETKLTEGDQLEIVSFVGGG
jgi:thiamine biosynthesis protein ThiS